MTRTALFPRTGRGTALCGVLLLITAEGLAVALAPHPLRLFLSGTLIGASTAGLLLALLLATSRRRAGAAAAAGARPFRDDAQWFSARSLDGFPMEQVRPLLLAPGAPGLSRLYTAWVFATHGHDPQWIARHLDLPVRTARLLVTAARRHTGAAPTR
ncbi:hypothetical protein DR950_34800 [Kitasatospora xanthocidica]|uniref:Uncharacterized protein n=1 Tax=Kitasatospora xanthocidica TaxID=83382 RepID=A0A373A273_9ACTN|nr:MULTISPECIES: hypothetical protein [Kitasatospora]RGD62233.1 hypothetical protein DR950_34800 [Kitasatospora xanthocidica]